MPVTLIVEPNPGGHRFDVVADVAGFARTMGDVVLLTCIGARERTEFEVSLGDAAWLRIEQVYSTPTPATRELVRRIADHCRDHEVATVVLLDADTPLRRWWFDAARGFRGLSTRPRVVFFFTRYPARLTSWDPARWRLRAAKAILVVAAMATRTLDRASGYAGRDERPGGWLVKRVRDTAVCRAHSRDRPALRAELGLPPNRLLVGIFGGINERKCPEMVFDAIEQTGLDAGLVLAGPSSEGVRVWLETMLPPQRANVFATIEFLPNEVLDSYVAAVDVVALAMVLEGPSGIMGKALAAGVPVVSAGSRTRARELAVTNGGVSTSLSVAGFAEGLRRVLTDPDRYTPDGAAVAAVTSESFAASILGVPKPSDAAPKKRGHARVRSGWHRVRTKFGPSLLERYLRPTQRADLVRLGSDYGGWWVPEPAVRSGAVAYCAGAGEDITFDLALHERGCAVTVFDPTPRAIAHVDANAPADARFRFVPVGWWDEEDELRFYSPRHAEHVSHSVVNLQGTSDYFVAKVAPVHKLMAELGDEHVDIVKLDIEGAEYRTLAAMLARGPWPSVLCVEFDQPQPLRRTVTAVRALRRAGYELNKIDQWNLTFTRD